MGSGSIWGDGVLVRTLRYTPSSDRPVVSNYHFPGHLENDQLLVKVEYAALNWSDLPDNNNGNNSRIVFGKDFSGNIIQVADNLKNIWKIGDRICGMKDDKTNVRGGSGHGTMASHILIDINKDAIIEPPKKLSDIEAGAFSYGFGTAYRSLQYGKKLLKNSKIFIIGGTTNVGMFITEIAKNYYNAERIVVTSMSENLALSLGADKVIDYSSSSVYSELRNYMNGQKFNLIIDCIGENNVLQNLEGVLERDGDYVSLVGRQENPPSLFNYHIEQVRPGKWIETAKDLIEADKIHIIIDSVFNWLECDRAIRKMRSTTQTRGKVVLSME